MIPHYTARQGLLSRNLEAEFGRPHIPPPDANILAARRMIGQSAIVQHRFFTESRSPAVMTRYWISQELFLVNSLSQLILRVSSDVSNVHLRQMLLGIELVEHGFRERSGKGGGQAVSNHALIAQLAEQLDIRRDSVGQMIETLDYMQTLKRSCRSLMSALGVIDARLGRIRVEECIVVRDVCESAFSVPSTALEFFDASIAAGSKHEERCETMAMALKDLGHDTSNYLSGTTYALAARVRFYNAAARRTA